MDWDAMQYEQKGYIKGSSAIIKDTDVPIVIVSNPKVNDDGQIYLWVALQNDTFTKFKINIKDIKLV